MALLTAISGSSMVLLDGTVVNLALPVLQKTFNSEISVLQWFVEAYALTLASLMLAGGALGDRFGERLVYVWGTVIFAFASLAAGLAGNSACLIAARAVQGIGGALIVPGSLALLTKFFIPERRSRAIGIWSALSAVTMAFGPIAGGWLIAHFSWKWVFFINLPFAVFTVVLCCLIDEPKSGPKSGPLDLAGSLSVTVGLACVTFALIEWPSSAHRVWLFVVGVLGVMFLGLFGAIEHRSESPLLPFALFRSNSFAVANLLTFLVYAPLGGLLFLAPLDLIQNQGYTTTEAGSAFLPFVVAMLALSIWTGRIADRYGARWPLTLGCALNAAGYILFACLPQNGDYWLAYFPGVLALSLGMALIVAPLTAIVMASVPGENAGIASAINNAVSRIAGLVAVAIVGVLLAIVFTHRLEHRLQGLDLTSNQRRTVRDNRFQLAAIESSDPGLNAAVHESFILAYRVVLSCMFASAMGAAGLSFFLVRQPARAYVASAAQHHVLET